MTKNKMQQDRKARRWTTLGLGMILLAASTPLVHAQEPALDNQLPAIPPFGTDGEEEPVIEYRNGMDIDTTCGPLVTTCAGAGALVLDFQETFEITVLGKTLSKTVGISVAVAASTGLAAALPTGSVWVRGWTEIISSEFEEYELNGFVDNGEVADNRCFQPVPTAIASCQDGTGEVEIGGGNCIRAMAQAKAANAFESAFAQNNPTELYVAAETKATCYEEDALGRLLGRLSSESQESSSGQINADGECEPFSYTDLPNHVQGTLADHFINGSAVMLDRDQARLEAASGGLQEQVHLELVEALVGLVEESLLSSKVYLCDA